MIFANKKMTLISAAIAIALLAIGGFLFFKDIVYYEREQLYYMIGFTALCVGFFLSTIRLRYVAMGILSVFMVVILVFSSMKYDWRSDFINATDYGQKSILMEQINRYPSYESYLINRFNNEVNWVDFSRECIAPALANKAMDQSCLTQNLINQNYGIDIQAELAKQFKRMKYTVQQIERKRIKTKRQYTSCITSKRCASVPLLPTGVKADEIDPRSDDYLETRQLFWEIASSQELSKEICAVNAFCSAMQKMGVAKLRSNEAIAKDQAAKQNQRPTTTRF